jgi:N-acetylated-alpha-linked acidic dipeptidase
MRTTFLFLSLFLFSVFSFASDKTLEATFDTLLQRDSLRVWMKRLTARPHHTGSTYGKENADFLAEQFKSWGYETNTEVFYVLFPTPKKRLLEMFLPERYSAKLTEPEIPEDATSGQKSEQLPPYNAYSCDGDVTAEVVYVNYGVPKDYEVLERYGIDVKGKIVIARYGGSWRGIKPKVAAEHGAIGCIIYSDPKDDGYFQGDVYPKGAFRNENGVQRGSVADMPMYAGDPLTPFNPAVKNASRLSIEKAPTITKIPVLPISSSDALPLLRSLSGPVAPEEWRGALPITYHIGPGKTKVHLKVEFNWEIVPIYNVIARIKGSEIPDEWIIRGNHHDAWVNGAKDPVSGLVAMMEEARALSELIKQGWQPKRSIIYCAWDAEEQGLLGSTEWVEAYADILKQKAVVYINSDSNGRGFLFMGGSHALEKFVNEVARDVLDPQTKISVHQRAKAQAIVSGKDEERKELRERNDLRLAALGSGSDYTPFLQHLGVPSLHIGFGGEDEGGSYHSIYDSYDHYTRFIDPTFEYGVALAQVGGRLVMRLADADVLPFHFSGVAEAIEKYINEVIKLTDDMRKETEELNQQIKENSLLYAADPKIPFVVPTPKDTVPHFDFSPLQEALAAVQSSAKEYEKILNSLHTIGKRPVSPMREEINKRLFQMEQSLTRRKGLPGRPWFVHQLYAPGQYTGYGVKTLPAVREAIEMRKWDEAREHIGVVANLLQDYAKQIDRATSVLQFMLNE